MKFSQEQIAGTFMDLFLRNVDYAAFAGKIEQVLEHPVKISDITRNPLAFSPGYPKDDDEDHRNLYRHVPPDQQDKHQAHLSGMFITGKPVLYAFPYMRRNRYLCGAIYDGVWMGHITAPDIGRFDTLDIDAMAYCAKMLGMYLRLKGAPHEKNFNNGHFLLWALLNGHVTDEDIYSRVIYPVFDGLSLFRLLWFDAAIDEDFYAYLAQVVRHFWNVTHMNGTVILIGHDDAHRQAGEIEQISAWVSEHHLRCSISDPYRDVMLTAKEYELIRRTLAQATELHGAWGAFYYDDYKLMALIEDSRQHLDMRLYEHSLPGEIERYDVANHTEYLTTLKAYLFSHMDTAATADRLHVHKNTVFYRLNKIRELFRIDFTDVLSISTICLSVLIQQRSPEF